MAKKVMTVVGARPQFVKASVVSRVMAQTEGLHETLVHTGQHYDFSMSQVFFDELEIPLPEVHLGVGSGNHGRQTGQMLERLEDLMLAQRPDWVMVYGDTNSTLAGALAAAKLHIPVAHVEAGLRSFNRTMPEEINRVLTDHCSEVLFAPTPTAVQNLSAEGIAAGRICQVGDVMFDAALFYAKRAEQHSSVLQHLGLEAKGYDLITIHRAQNTDLPERLHHIVAALIELSHQQPGVWPLHPRTRKALEVQGLLDQLRQASGVHLLEPVGYLDMVKLEKNARAILTDSGGIQKEAYFHRVPCVVLREETEWVELLQSGWVRLAPPTAELNLSAVIQEMQTHPKRADDSYGDGQAAQKIVRRLLG